MSRAATEAYPPTLGVVLAGGRASRMGGTDKSRIRVGGRTILERVLDRLRPQCSRVVLSAGANAARFADTGDVLVPDSVPDYAGPLAGILAGLDWAAGHTRDIEWAVSVPSDCPFLPRDLVARLHGARSEAGKPLACAGSGRRRHPAIALWPVAMREDLRSALLSEGLRTVDEWVTRFGAGVAEWPSDPVDPFFNVNTPDDAAEAERIAAQHPEI